MESWDLEFLREVTLPDISCTGNWVLFPSTLLFPPHRQNLGFTGKTWLNAICPPPLHPGQTVKGGVGRNLQERYFKSRCG